jgi:RNA polymerase sigma-70 factor (ECF subfamily)
VRFHHHGSIQGLEMTIKMAGTLAGDAALMLGYDYGSSNRAGSNTLQQRILDRFFAGVEKRAYRLAYIATGNGEDALDIVQDTMLKMVEKYADKPEDQLTPLFFCILQSRIRDWYRRSAVRNRFRTWFGSDDDEEAEDPLEQIADPAGRTPDEILAARGGLQALEVALRELPLRQQQVFLLRAWEGLDVKQTARAMQCAEGSVKTHYSRALAKLRQKLGDHWQ